MSTEAKRPRAGPVGWIVAALLLARVVFLVLAIRAVPPSHVAPAFQVQDLLRFQQIAEAKGRPYRDVEVEYAPVDLLVVEAIAGPDARSTATRLGWTMLVLDVATSVVLLGTWGRRTMVVYLALGTPLLGFLYFRLDLVSVALAVAAFALLERGHERTGGAVLGVAVLSKIWPVVLAPAALLERRWRGLFAAAVSAAAGLAGWLFWGGFGGPVEVFTFRGATGWQFESLVGSLWWALTGAPQRHEAGSQRVGVSPGWARALLLAIAIAGIAFVWDRARRRDGPALGAPAAAAVTVLLLAAPILSLQYVAWLLPWVAIEAAAGSGWLTRLTLAVSVMTGALGAVYARGGEGLAVVAKALLVARNTLLVVLVVAYFARTLRRDPRSEAVAA